MTTATMVRAVCEYQLFSDSEGEQWMKDTLDLAHTNGDLAGYVVTGAYVGAWGLQLVTFCVDLPITPDGYVTPEMTHEEAKASVTDLLNQVIGDSDVDVRWIAALA